MKTETCTTCDNTGYLAKEVPGYDGTGDIDFEPCPDCKFSGQEIRDAMLKVGLDVLDTSSMSDVFELAWRAGRLYEAEKTLKEMKVQIQAS